jgi:methylthioribose-1-phosphate isomerase
MNLTAWELQRAGIPYTLVSDNACGQLMREGRVDCVIVGSDRTAANGDVCNKVGTYLKALSAAANDVPFYVALPVSTLDWECAHGDDIPIEVRDEQELLSITGLSENNAEARLGLAAKGSTGHNIAFDVTPAQYVNQLVTEYGCYEPSRKSLAALKLQALRHG